MCNLAVAASSSKNFIVETLAFSTVDITHILKLASVCSASSDIFTSKSLSRSQCQRDAKPADAKRFELLPCRFAYPCKRHARRSEIPRYNASVVTTSRALKTSDQSPSSVPVPSSSTSLRTSSSDSESLSTSSFCSSASGIPFHST